MFSVSGFGPVEPLVDVVTLNGVAGGHIFALGLLLVPPTSNARVQSIRLYLSRLFRTKGRYRKLQSRTGKHADVQWDYAYNMQGLASH